MQKTILLIDDNEEVRENVAELLTLSGYLVITASDGKDGVEKAKKQQPDLILCDVMMPNIDGWGVKHILSKDLYTQNIPFIFLTARTDKSDFRNAIDLGANDFITKPYQANELLNSIERVLRRTEQTKSDPVANISTTGSAKTDKDPMHALIEHSDIRDYKKGQNIYKLGGIQRYLYYIKSGKVKTYKAHQDGKDLVTDLYGDDDFFGYQAIFDDVPYTETAEAMEDTEVVLIQKKAFEDIVYNHLPTMKKFLKLMAKEIIMKDEHILGIAYNTLRKKVADALVTLNAKYNNQKKDNFTININRDALASIAGTATESLIRTLTDFKDEKLIDMGNGSITILNSKKLGTLIR